MGVAQLLSLFTLCVIIGFPVNVLEGSVVGIDASIFLYQLCARHAIDVASGNFARVLDDFMNVMEILVAHGSSPVVVFDGAGYKPKLASIAQKRTARREASLRLYEAAENHEDKLKHAKGFARPTSAMVSALALRLKGAGISYIVAPHEADAQLALLSQEGITHFTMSTDQDLIVHGIFRLLNNWSNNLESGRFFSLQQGLSAVEGSPKATELEVLLRPLSEMHQLRALRVLAVTTGCDYFKLANKCGVKSALKGLKASAHLLGRADVSENQIIAAVVKWLFRNVQAVQTNSEYTEPVAVSKAQLAAAAFLHAPAFSVKEQKVVLLSGSNFDSLTADVREYLGFSVGELNADSPVLRALGGVADDSDSESWVLKLPGYRYVSFPVAGMIPDSLAEHVKPVASCTKNKLETYLRFRQLGITGTVDELRRDVANQIFRECHVIEKQRSIIVPGTNLFALKSKHGATLGDVGMAQISSEHRFPQRTDDGASAASVSGPWVFREFGKDAEAFKAMPTVTDALLLRHWSDREVHAHMKPLVRGDAVARMLSLSAVASLLWAFKKNGSEHWIQMPVPPSMCTGTYLVRVLLVAEKPSCLPAADVPASISMDPCFVRIVVATCDKECAAGQSGACWHVACVLFLLRYMLRGDLDDASPTSKLCRWIVPSARWLLQPARSIPLAFMDRANLNARQVSAVPRLLWNADPQLLSIGGRASIALPHRERIAERSDESKRAARASLYRALSDHFKQECSAEWGWDKPTERLKEHKDSVVRKHKKMRTTLLSGAIPVGIQVSHSRDTDAVAADPMHGLDILAGAAGFAGMNETQLRSAAYVWSQHHPSKRMPPLAGGARTKVEGERVDYAKDFLCPVHGRLSDLKRHATGPARSKSHFDAAGQCRTLASVTDKDALYWWLKKWKLPEAGQTYYEANPAAVASSGKRKRS
jgi:5'-3' exonuclease